MHESFATNPDKSLEALTWTAFWVGGRYAEVMHDFDTFVTEAARFVRKDKCESWMHSTPASDEMHKIRTAMPSLADELEALMQQSPEDSLASLMLTMVRPHAPY